MKSNKTLKILFYLIILSPFLLIIKSIISDYYDKSNYLIGYYLINYQGGFVRRGLLGECITILYKTLNINPIYSIKTIAGFSLITYFFIIATKLLKERISILLLFTSLLFGFFVYNHHDWIRPDIFIVNIFFLGTQACKLKNKLYRFILVNILLSINILIHESTLFFSFSIYFLLIYNQYHIKNKKQIIKAFILSLFFFTPIYLAIFFIFTNHGSPEMITKIIDYWNSSELRLENFNGNAERNYNLQVLGISLKEGIMMTYNNIFLNKEVVLLWLLLISIIFYIFRNFTQIFAKKKDENANKNLFYISLVQFISISPLFILGTDYGRWIFFWTSTSIITFLYNPSLLSSIHKYINSKFKSNIIPYLPIINKYSIYLLIGYPCVNIKPENYYIYTNLFLIYKLIKDLIN